MGFITPGKCCQICVSVSTRPIIHCHLPGGCLQGEREPVEVQKKRTFSFESCSSVFKGSFSNKKEVIDLEPQELEGKQ